MATKKLLKEVKPAFKTPPSSKKPASTKANASKEKSVSPLIQTKKKTDKKANYAAATSKTKIAADKLTKSSTGKSTETVGPGTKKLKAPVKKTSIDNANESKVTVSSKKETNAAKKPKTGTAAEKETKPSKPSKSSLKAVKLEQEEMVVIPKTTTDKKVDYEPDFMKSVLDTPAASPAKPSTRYSDADLQEFKDLIGKKLDAAKKELAYLQGLITRRDEMGGDETDNRYMTMEDGGMSMEREQLSQMASRQITFIDHLEKALMRIESKTYGICRVTGKLIDKARLRAVPHATLSMEAKMGINKSM